MTLAAIVRIDQALYGPEGLRIFDPPYNESSLGQGLSRGVRGGASESIGVGCPSVGWGPGVTLPKSRPSGMKGRSRWLLSRSRLSSRARYGRARRASATRWPKTALLTWRFNARRASLVVLPSATRRSK